jgi:DNA-binding response OmpR family regulator
MAALLVVDDDRDVLVLLSFHCAARGHKVAVAQTFEEGLSLAASRPADLVLLDFCLPKMDGARFIEILRADEPTKRTPVIVMSAASPTWVASRLASDPLVQIIEKPLDFASLDRMIEDMVVARPGLGLGAISP